jgi:hypothetical protein
MPTGVHESPLALAVQAPDLLVELLTGLFGVAVPPYEHAQSESAKVQDIAPRTYYADGMTIFRGAANRALLAVVLEVQRRWDPDKVWTWPIYVAHPQAAHKVEVALLVYCPDRAVARRYRDAFAAKKLSMRLHPYVFTPDDIPLVTDVDQAREKPVWTILSAICHGDEPRIDLVFPALGEAVRKLGLTNARTYDDIVLAGLPKAARARWEAFMSTAIPEYQSELFRELTAKGKTEGKAEGKAESVLQVLKERGLTVPEATRERIESCIDLELLDTWLRRAITASTIDELFQP